LLHAGTMKDKILESLATGLIALMLLVVANWIRV
jgi:hypothetical protein